jgi:hypothetical protein
VHWLWKHFLVSQRRICGLMDVVESCDRTAVTRPNVAATHPSAAIVAARTVKIVRLSLRKSLSCMRRSKQATVQVFGDKRVEMREIVSTKLVQELVLK